jgi:hypothetical protein
VRLLLRLAFSALLVIGVVAQLHAVRPYDTDAESVASLVAPLAALGLASAGPDADGVIIASAPGCPLPVRVGMVYVSGGEESRAASLLGPGVQPRYVYLGMVLDHDDRWRLYFRGLHGTVASLLGARSRRSPSHMVMAVLPDACPRLADLDWAVLSPWK